jgi:hypothetical protein
MMAALSNVASLTTYSYGDFAMGYSKSQEIPQVRKAEGSLKRHKSKAKRDLVQDKMQSSVNGPLEHSLFVWFSFRDYSLKRLPHGAQQRR